MDVTQCSKFLSYVLRHNPADIGVKLDEQGWISIDTLIAACNKKGKHIDRPLLERVVAENNKKRFAISEDGKNIRASQGHSVKIDLGYKAQEPPYFLYHGTATRYVDAIMNDGLKKMNRHAVHLSASKKTAISVGSRHGQAIVLVIDANAMHQDGYEFFVSENNVWLTDNVPVQYISKMKV